MAYMWKITMKQMTHTHRLGIRVIGVLVLLVLMKTALLPPHQEAHTLLSQLYNKTRLAKILELNYIPTDNQEINTLQSLKSSNVVSIYLCYNMNAGLGNMMYMFASLYGVSKRRGFNLVLSGDFYLRSTFQIDGAYLTNMKVCKGSRSIAESACCRVADNIYNISNSTSVSVNGYFQSYKYFSNYQTDIRNYFTFKENIKIQASNKLTKLLSESYHGRNVRQYRTLIGIHIRRGDYLSTGSKRFGYKVAPKEYLYEAQHIMLKNYTNVTFIACSNDLVWTKTVFKYQENVIVVPMGSANVDLALLALMDHMIITVGTYSFWAGWFCQGTVIYYKDFVDATSQLGRMHNPVNTDTYYSTWIGI